MNEEQALKKMVAPGTKRLGKWRQGVLQIHLTRACDLKCSNCTQGSQFGGKAPMMTLENFELACQSLEGYFGVVGIFGGNPALHPQFEEICEILRQYFPREQCGLWCNNPMGKGAAMRATFNPSVSNLNCHLKTEAYQEFKRDWPESMPFGLQKDSHHSPVHISMLDVGMDESARWDAIANCDINKHWSAMIGQFRGEARGYFCEVAGGQAILNQFNDYYPDTGTKLYPGWWRESMEAFRDQVNYHCHRCSVPLRLTGSSAQKANVTHVSAEYEHLTPKGNSAQLHVINDLAALPDEPLTKFTEYLQNEERKAH